jgi:uncharacterized protein (TIGR02145 family)
MVIIKSPDVDENNKKYTSNFKKRDMEKAKIIIRATGIFILLFCYGNMSGNSDHTVVSKFDQTETKSTQTTTKTTQTTTKPPQTTTKSTPTTTKSPQTTSKTTQTTTKSPQTTTKSTQTTTKSAKTSTKSTKTTTKTVQPSAKPVTDNKNKDTGTITIGTQVWSAVNLNVVTFRNGDTIPEAKTNKEWETAGSSEKPAWCYYTNDPVNGKKYGKLYNWYAVNDPRELAPVGWRLSSDEDWAELTHYLGGQQAAGTKMKSSSGWIDGNNGTNESGFSALPGGYRVENGKFVNLGSIGTWWSTTESSKNTAIDHYLILSGSIGRGNNLRQRGESVRCLRE